MILQRMDLMSGDFSQWRIILTRQIKRLVPQLFLACVFTLLVIALFIKLNHSSLRPLFHIKNVEESEEVPDSLLSVYIDQCKCHKHIPKALTSLNKRKRRDDAWSSYYQGHPQSFPEIIQYNPDKKTVQELMR